MAGIDTEWRPDSRQEDNAVAMIQLASSSCVVLIRTCTLGGIPQPVINFCKCVLCRPIVLNIIIRPWEKRGWEIYSFQKGLEL